MTKKGGFWTFLENLCDNEFRVESRSARFARSAPIKHWLENDQKVVEKLPKNEQKMVQKDPKSPKMAYNGQKLVKVSSKKSCFLGNFRATVLMLWRLCKQEWNEGAEAAHVNAN